MKRTVLFPLLLGLFSVALPTSAQVVPSATGSRPTLSAGALFTYTQPDAECDPYACAIKTSDNHIMGIGGLVDYRMSRWLQLEAEGRWQHWNQYTDQSIRENTYAIGIRDPIRTFGRITPYGKGMIGFGTGSFLTGHAAMYVLGGGADYRLNKKFSLRADFEYQHWRVTPVLHPYTGGIGIVYRIF